MPAGGVRRRDPLACRREGVPPAGNASACGTDMGTSGALDLPDTSLRRMQAWDGAGSKEARGAHTRSVQPPHTETASAAWTLAWWLPGLGSARLLVDNKADGWLRRAHVLETCMPAGGLQLQLDGGAEAAKEINARSSAGGLMLGNSAPHRHPAAGHVQSYARATCASCRHGATASQSLSARHLS